MMEFNPKKTPHKKDILTQKYDKLLELEREKKAILRNKQTSLEDKLKQYDKNIREYKKLHNEINESINIKLK